MKPGDFPPARQRGQTLHLVLILLLAIVVVVLVFLISRQPIGPVLMVFVLLAVLAFLPIPFLVYRHGAD